MTRAGIRLLLAALIILAPAAAHAWGTMAKKVDLTDEENTALTQAVWVGMSGSQRTRFRVEREARRGPFPVHQFIALKAWEIVERDPAFEDSGLPDIEEINQWDGVVRTQEGPRARKPDEIPRFYSRLVPAAAPGPGADAELLSDGKTWNKDYRGSAHYYSPILGCGGAPAEAAKWYSQLVDGIVEGKDADKLGRAAHYMAHYIGDVASPKHGHTISPLTPIELIKLHGYAKELVKLDEGFNDNVDTYTEHESVDNAIRVFKGAAARCTSDSQVLRDYWALVDEKIGLNAWIVGGFGFLATAAPSSLRASTAAYLHALGSAKMSDGQWGNNFDYFDPFYFNGPVLDTFSGRWKVDFKATQVLGEHLRYETEPNHNAWVKSLTKTEITKMADGEFIRFTGDVPGYAPFEAGAGIATPTDGAVRAAARLDAVGGVVRWTAQRSNGDQKFDLWGKSTPMLARHVRIAIAGVATALRASISALRAKATLIETKMSDRVAVRAVVRSVADVPATLTDVVLGTPTGKTWAHERTSSRPIEGARLGPSDEIEVTWIIRVDDDDDPPKPEDFHVDIFGHYDGVPDSGWRREHVEQGLRLGTLDDVAATDTTGVPVDLVIVFDITGSMQSSIDSVRGHATKVVETLQRESGDLRLALVGFRDVADDSAAPFEAHTFSGDISGQLARMNEWKAKGGGDTPEDQLAAIKKGIQFWYDNPRPPENQPVKLIVVITDAPAKDPDGESTTIKKIAKAAFEVDPAHIYPIVVGNNPKALDHARELAELSSGKVFVADDGDAVADALIEVVRDGIARHASEIDHSWRPSLTMVRVSALAGGLLVIIGLLMIVLPSRRASSKSA